MLNKSFKLNDKRVRDANQALEDSMDTRQKAKHKLSMCSGKGDLAPLEKKTEDLNATDLNRKVRNSGESGTFCGTRYFFQGMIGVEGKFF